MSMDLNMTIDGTGTTCPAGASRVVGIELTNLGDASWSSAAAILDNSVVRNLSPCDLAEGIDSEYFGRHDQRKRAPRHRP